MQLRKWEFHLGCPQQYRILRLCEYSSHYLFHKRHEDLLTTSSQAQYQRPYLCLHHWCKHCTTWIRDFQNIRRGSGLFPTDRRRRTKYGHLAKCDIKHPTGHDDNKLTTTTDYAVTLPDDKTALVEAYVNDENGTEYSTLFTVEVVAPSEIPVGKSLNITRVPGVERGLSFPVCSNSPHRDKSFTDCCRVGSATILRPNAGEQCSDVCWLVPTTNTYTNVILANCSASPRHPAMA